jgi:hypothetical protein
MMNADAASLTSVRQGAESDLTDKAALPLVSINRRQDYSRWLKFNLED